MAKIRIHRETYEDLCRYAAETGFCGALQDYLEECGLEIKVHEVFKDDYSYDDIEVWDINHKEDDRHKYENANVDRIANHRRHLVIHRKGKDYQFITYQETGYYEGEIAGLS